MGSRAPGVERRHARQTCHVPAIIDNSPAGQPPAVALRHLRGPPGHGQARCEALDVPFERGGQGLVEIIDIEDPEALG